MAGKINAAPIRGLKKFPPAPMYGLNAKHTAAPPETSAMSTPYPFAALRHYNEVGNQASIEASPHKLIDMLLGGALDRLATARGCMLRGDRSGKLAAVSSVVSIVEHLRLSLDMQAGGELAQNLSRLYDYMVRRLLKANADDSPVMVEEVSGLVRELKLGWEAMPAVMPTRH
ncbi:MAG TPA: flagellar export chaperone FliS [Nevskiaceae bacterium]|nr:flagellar export chaperone FliS [Nevskiaceae bacterium]